MHAFKDAWGSARLLCTFKTENKVVKLRLVHTFGDEETMRIERADRRDAQGGNNPSTKDANFLAVMAISKRVCVCVFGGGQQ